MKLKKILAAGLGAVMFAGLLSGCSGSSGKELALVTDLGTIDDKSFNQGAWEGLKKYADEKKKSYKYYQPTEQSTDAYLAAIDLAVKGGAKVIVTPGYLFEEPVYKAQDTYPNVKFILIDGSPNNNDWSNGMPTYKTGANTVGVTYAEEQAGFLAGYAAVKDGYRALGFMGGMAVPAVIRYGYGFIQGAEYAGQELGLGSNEVTIKYNYTGGFAATPEAQAMASSWYKDGVQVIFACGGAVGNSVMAAAEANSGKVIGVDVDQSSESATVVTSAMKELKNSVYDCIKDYYDSKFKGGQDIVFSAANAGVGLPMATSKFTSFKQADYDDVFGKLKSDKIAIVRDADSSGSAVTISQIPKTVVNVTEIN